MKKLILSIGAIVVISVMLQAQTSKTINLTVAGTLSDSLTASNRYTITNLTITGNIDARDFKTMNDSMTKLIAIDLHAATIAAYSGIKGTYGNDSFYVYPANTIPVLAFQGETPVTENLQSLIIPESTTRIDDGALLGPFYKMTTFTIPASVTSVGEENFWFWNVKTLIVGNPNPLIYPDIAYSNLEYEMDTTVCVIYVPKGSGNAYKTADKWKSYKIVEVSPDLLFVAAPDTIETTVKDNGTLKLHSTKHWDGSCDKSWLSISPTSGEGDTIITLKPTENYDSTRTAIVSISSAGETTLKAFVTQKSGDVTIIKIKTTELSLYPNPASTVLYCKAASGSIASIYAIDGTQVLSQYISNNGAIQIDALKAGIYFIKIQTDDNKTIVERFTKL
jgi:hypothetical protein